VTYDPAKITYAALLDAWTRGRERDARVFAKGDAQKHAAAARSLAVADAVAFRAETAP